MNYQQMVQAAQQRQQMQPDPFQQVNPGAANIGFGGQRPQGQQPGQQGQPQGQPAQGTSVPVPPGPPMSLAPPNPGPSQPPQSSGGVTPLAAAYGVGSGQPPLNNPNIQSAVTNFAPTDFQRDQQGLPRIPMNFGDAPTYGGAGGGMSSAGAGAGAGADSSSIQARLAQMLMQGGQNQQMAPTPGNG